MKFNIYICRNSLKPKYIFSFIVIFALLRILIENELEESLIVQEIHSKNLKAIQLLTQRFYFPNWGLEKLGTHPFSNCAENRCYAFQPHFWRNKPFEQSDGIMVHVPDLHFMPNRDSYKRDPKQLWLFYSLEPQRYSFCSHYFKVENLFYLEIKTLLVLFVYLFIK